MKAVILGSNSDIAKAIIPMLEADGYEVHQWHTGKKMKWPQWDLAVITIGKVAPVGLWHDVDIHHWQLNIFNNLTAPFLKLRSIWSKRNLWATVIWFAGSNPQKIMDGYSAYNTSKMAVLKLVEQLDHESPDCKFIAFGPGYVKTKIHQATLDAKWPNERIERGDEGNSMEDIYKAMRWCIEQPKRNIGGRNICVSDMGKMITGDFGKLRRVE